MDYSLSMCHLYVLAAKTNRILGCLIKSAASRSRNNLSLQSLHMRLHLEFCAQIHSIFLVRMRDIGILEQDHWKASKIIKELEHPSKSSLVPGDTQGAGLVQPEEEKAKGRLYCSLSYLMEGVEKTEAEFASFRVHSGRRRCKGHSLDHGKFWLSIKKCFFSLRVVKEWNQSEEAVVSILGSAPNSAGLDLEQPVWTGFT